MSTQTSRAIEPQPAEMNDLKPDAPDGIRGEFTPIATTQPGLMVTEHLPRFAKVLGKFAQIRSVNHRMKNHNTAGYYSLTGMAPPTDDQRLRDSRELFPAFGSVVDRFDAAALSVQVARDFAQEIRRDQDLDLHDRFQNDGLCKLRRFLERH